MRRTIGGFDLGDSVFQPLIVGAGLGKLVINFESELTVALLQIELGHRLVDEWLGAWPGEHPVFLPRLCSLMHIGTAGRIPVIERLRLLFGSRFGAGRGERIHRRLTFQTLSTLGLRLRCPPAQAFGTAWIRRFRYAVQSSGGVRLRYGAMQPFGTQWHLVLDRCLCPRRQRCWQLQRGFDRIVAFETRRRSGDRRFRSWRRDFSRRSDFFR